MSHAGHSAKQRLDVVTKSRVIFAQPPFCLRKISSSARKSVYFIEKNRKVYISRKQVIATLQLFSKLAKMTLFDFYQVMESPNETLTRGTAYFCVHSF